jgi:hypothetical protein
VVLDDGCAKNGGVGVWRQTGVCSRGVLMRPRVRHVGGDRGSDWSVGGVGRNYYTINSLTTHLLF